jgi:hypothetical protein
VIRYRAIDELRVRRERHSIDMKHGGVVLLADVLARLGRG